jgi:signal transduction histidine kinase
MWHRFKRITEICVVALLAVFAAAIVRAVCHALFNETIPYTPFYPAIVVSTMYGRMTGGVISVVLAAFAASFWIPPFGQPLIQEPTDLVGLVLFIMVSGVVVRLCEAMRRAQQLAESATSEERLAVVREQAARVEAEKANRLKDEFLALVSHELRTPLQAILGWAHLLKQSGIDEADRVQALDTIERNARLQSRLIEDLLDVSRIAAGKLRVVPRTVNPKHVVDSAIQSVSTAAQAKQISLERRYQESDLAVWADPDRLQQIVWSNERKYHGTSPWHSGDIRSG